MFYCSKEGVTAIVGNSLWCFSVVCGCCCLFGVVFCLFVFHMGASFDEIGIGNFETKDS